MRTAYHPITGKLNVELVEGYIAELNQQELLHLVKEVIGATAIVDRLNYILKLHEKNDFMTCHSCTYLGYTLGLLCNGEQYDGTPCTVMTKDILVEAR